MIDIYYKSAIRSEENIQFFNLRSTRCIFVKERKTIYMNYNHVLDLTLQFLIMNCKSQSYIAYKYVNVHHDSTFDIFHTKYDILSDNPLTEP